LKLDKFILGWKEYCALPQLKIPLITAKIDTGAYTSCLHAFNLETALQRGQKYIYFDTYPIRFNESEAKHCSAPIVDYRIIRSSNGEHERRYVIETELVLGSTAFITELTLTDRSELNFRMLLGRSFLKGHALIDVHLSLNQGKPAQEIYQELYDKHKN